MFKISPIQDANTQIKYTEMTSSEYRAGHFAYAMTDYETGDLMAISQFEIDKNEAHISDLRAVPTLSDFEAMFILGRQTMNFIDMCGVENIVATEETADERLLIALGFKRKGNLFFCNTAGMFDGHCSGEAKKLD